jgi:hypothetical protein
MIGEKGDVLVVGSRSWSQELAQVELIRVDTSVAT